MIAAWSVSLRFVHARWLDDKEAPQREAARWLDDKEAPQREAARMADEKEAERARLEKARLLNKLTFRP